MVLQSKKMDRRIRRTRRFLKDGLISLINKKEFDSISVSDIVRHSNINRSTFYAHYQDKEELMSVIINELVHGMIQSVRETATLKPTLPFQHDFPAIITKDLFNYVENHAAYFQSLMNNQHDPQLIQRLSDSFYKIYLNEIENYNPEDTKLSVNKGFFASYFTSVIIGFIYHWLMNTNMKYSSEYTAKELNKLIHLEPDYAAQVKDGINEKTSENVGSTNGDL